MEALKQQQNEINDFFLYMELSKLQKNKNNKKILQEIALQEKSHYEFWKKITKKDLKPQKWLILMYIFLAKLFGISFTLKLLEKNEEKAEDFYKKLILKYPQAKKIYEDEKTHEIKLLNMLNDQKLLYAGAVVLGMNDALVELTGTLTGIALAFDNAKYVGITGMIMGIAASLSMAGSAYLEARENADSTIEPKKYAIYTGFAYILTTAILVSPFFLIKSAKVALVFMFIGAVVSILFYNFYISVAKDENFKKRVGEMFLITFGVALISFIIGYFVNKYLGIEI
ncbi:VIT1/CCC1 transporter family protein [Nitrosophilus kaiyonis]|uniref:VIT1/CCC1 transporter family protein n=1 Tax=Nitrosophilus kaiyonis TaxID=2930200 RepID=UPI002492C4E6|nr:VIT1/CCC1 transporter family protein [Nitrosophilus kaiyonis]